MRVAIAGSSGLIGATLVTTLETEGHDVVRMVRAPARRESTEIHWDPAGGDLDPLMLEGVDAVINLAGRGVADARWSKSQKQSIRDSRVRGNRLIAKTIGRIGDGPSVFVAGSAIGFYGDTGDSIVTESSPGGRDFLASVCTDLEAAASHTLDNRCRVVHARTGIVLSGEGGALAQILPFFRAGLGGRIGKGRQYWSWISIHDEVAALVHLLDSDLRGPVNLVAPAPVTNAEFTKTLATVLRRPAILPTPKPAMWAKLGRELTEALLYTSTRVVPEALLGDGFEFRHADLESALREILRRPTAQSIAGGSA